MENVDVDDLSSSSSDDSEMEEEDFTALLEEIADLEKTLRDSPFAYDTHVALVQARAKVGNIGKLRASFQKMSETFPLTQELWQLWIDAEVKQAEDVEDLQYIANIFANAVKDYLSLPLWLGYCDFMNEMASQLEEENPAGRVRAVFEEALMAGGLHVKLGSQLWNLYREFESDLLQGLESKLQEAPQGSPDQLQLSKDVEAGKSRVLSIYRRQLGVPLSGLEECLQDYEEFTMAPLPAPMQPTYQKAVADLEALQKYEDALAEAAAPRLKEYKSYIAYETERGAPARVQCIYERALAENCLQSDLWSQYGNWLDTKLKDSKTCLSVYHRACRNCPWVVSLWQARMLAMERHSKYALINGIFESAKQAGFSSATDYLQLWKTHCDIKRRRIDKTSQESVEEFRTTVDSAVEYMTQWFGDNGDPTCSLLRYRARIEAEELGNFEKASEIWRSTILTHGRGKLASLWLEYSTLVRAHGSVDACRKALLQAVQCVNDDCASVCQALLDFESERGTLVQWDAAQARCTAQLGRLEDRKLKADEKASQTEAEQQEKRRVARAERRQEKKADKQKPQMHIKPDTPVKLPQKRKAESQFFDDGSGRGSQILPARKKALAPGSTSDDGFQVPLLPSSYEASDKTSPKSPVASVAEPSDGGSPTLNAAQKFFAMSEEERMDESGPADGGQEQGRPKFEFNPENKNRTVFVSNLPIAVEEERLRGMFGKFGVLSDVRIVRKRFGAKKNCYAYMEYSDELPVQAALKLDRERIDNRPMFVSLCMDKEDSGRSVFKYATTLDSKTLYVSKLPSDPSQQEIAELFGKYGAVKEVRLVTSRSGATRSFCYVEMEHASDASKCVLHLDRHIFKGQPIGVALSDPSGRKPAGGQKSTAFNGDRSGGMFQPRSYNAQAAEGSVEPYSRGRSRTQITLLPRSVRSAGAAGGNSQAEKKATTDDNAGGDATSSAPESNKPKSNSDFRAMLLKK